MWLMREVISPKAESVVKILQSTNQLSAIQIQDIHSWYIADLDTETVSNHESDNKERTSLRYWLSQIEGQTFSTRKFGRVF